MQCFYVVLLLGLLLGLHFVLLLYGFTSKLKAKQTVCFYIDTISFGTKSVSLISLSSRLKIKIFARTVNHLVVSVETSDLQWFQFLIYITNHLVIVLMVLPRKQFISDNRVVHPPTAMDKNLNTDLTEDTDLTFFTDFFSW